MAEHLRELVVIKSGALERAVLPFEAKWLNEMQFASGIGAKPDHIAGVGGYLGLKQDDGGQAALQKQKKYKTSSLAGESERVCIKTLAMWAANRAVLS